MIRNWILLFLTVIPFIILTASAQADVEFTPSFCAEQLRDSAVFEGEQIRGVAISKIIQALDKSNEEARFRYEGVVFGRDSFFHGADGDYVDFRRASFATVLRFFKDVIALDAGHSEITITALEAAFMQKIGALVYGRTAFGLSRILSQYRRSNPPMPLSVVERLTVGKNGAPNTLSMDLRDTPAEGVRRFVELAESADPYVVGEYGPEVKRWVARVNEFFLEAKERDRASVGPVPGWASASAPAAHP